MQGGAVFATSDHFWHHLGGKGGGLLTLPWVSRKFLKTRLSGADPPPLRCLLRWNELSGNRYYKSTEKRGKPIFIFMTKGKPRRTANDRRKKTRDWRAVVLFD